MENKKNMSIQNTNISGENNIVRTKVSTYINLTPPVLHQLLIKCRFERSAVILHPETCGVTFATSEFQSAGLQF